MRCKILLLLCVLSSSACASSGVAPQPSKDAAPHDDLDASPLDASADASRSDAALEPDASGELDASKPDQPECPRGTTRYHATLSGPCARDNMECITIGMGVTCARQLHTAQSCAEAGGSVVSNPGDDCTGDTSIVGSVKDAAGDYRFCCRDIRDCAPQIILPWGSPAAELRWYWVGTHCRAIYRQGCTGADCDRIFSSDSECYAAYAHCSDLTRVCGSSESCFADEYCAYPPWEACGRGDQIANCQLRPEACEDVYDPVCTCDFETYPNACEASRAGHGLLYLGTCESHEGYCAAPCGVTNEAVIAACEAITDVTDCRSHKAEGALFNCRWTTDATSLCIGP